MTTATFDSFCPGVLEVLSIGKGDLKLMVDVDHPEDVEKARKLIEEMLRKGYSIYVETDGGPKRVKKFNPKRMVYIISEIVEEQTGGETAARTKTAAGKGRGKIVERQVPVAGSRATAVGRTAGG